MGGRTWHLARAKRHREVADHLRDADFEDWACVAIAYAAHQWVHSVLSGDPELAKDERHPRKHTSPPGQVHGGRGTNQLVNAYFPTEVSEAYASLFEAGRRTRYDLNRMGAGSYKLLEMQFSTVMQHCRRANDARPDRRTDEP